MSNVADDGTPVSQSGRARTDHEPLKGVEAPQQRAPGDPEPGSISAAAQELARRRWAKQQEAEGQVETPAPEEAPAEAPTEEPPVADDPAEEQESDDAGAEGGQDEEEGELAESTEEESVEDDPQPEEEAGPLELAEDSVILVNGEEVPFGDLVKGNLREADYTRRTQALSQERDALQQREQAVAAHFGQVERGMIEQIQELESNVNWAQVANESPDEFARLRAKHQGLVMQLQQHQTQSKTFLQNIEQVTQAARAQQAKIAKAQLKEDAKAQLKEDLPGWNDGMYYSLVNYAEEAGFNRDEALKFIDPNIFKVLHKAKQFDEAQKVGTTKVVKASPKRTVRATARSSQPRTQRLDPLSPAHPK
jgi:hypothetical protein